MRAFLLALMALPVLTGCQTTKQETLPGLRQEPGEDSLMDSMQRDLQDGSFDIFRAEF